jgi:hypothetical protein
MEVCSFVKVLAVMADLTIESPPNTSIVGLLGVSRRIPG